MVAPHGAFTQGILFTANTMEARARLLRLCVLAGGGLGLAIGMMGLFLQARMLWLLVPLPMAVGVAFVKVDEAILARWRARVTSPWEAGEFGLEEFRRTLEAFPFPRSTLREMLSTLPGGRQGRDPDSALLRRGFVQTTESLHQVRSDHQLVCGLARFFAVAGVFTALASGSWWALLLILGSGVVVSLNQPLEALRRHRWRHRVQVLQGAGLDLTDLRDVFLREVASPERQRIEQWFRLLPTEPNLK